jgi:glycosyltransferase involved in cell wall biosynthesis
MVTDNNSPLVSIIMPTYNRAAYIGETIASIQNQVYSNWELIIMDDGSEDDSQAIVKNINDSRIKYYNNGRVGITGTLKNKGITLSNGELIAFMDSDDLWHEVKLEQQVKALLQYTDAGFSFTNGHNFNEKGIEAVYYPKHEGVVCDSFFETICKGDTGVFIQSVMVWKKLLDESMLFRENRIFTDFSFIANLAYKHKAVLLCQQLLYRRFHQSNNVSQNWVLDYEEHIETIIRYCEEGRLSKTAANAILFKAYIHFGQEYHNYKNPAKARKQYMKAWSYKPFSIVPLKKAIKSFSN